MGTTYRVTLGEVSGGTDPGEWLPVMVRDRLREINDQMSHYQADSELSRFNRLGPGESFEVSKDFARVMEYSLGLNRRSGGVFDPALGGLIDAWGFGPPGRVNDADVNFVRVDDKALGADLLEWSGQRCLVKRREGVHLNLSAVAKGYAVDALAEMLTERGLEHILVEIGGEVGVRGSNPKGQPWQIGVRSPAVSWSRGGELAAVVQLQSGALATSGNTENSFTNRDGERITHLMDPRSRQPVARSLFSVTVWSTNCMDADGLATTLSVMGREAGNTWLRRNSSAEALWVEVAKDGSLKFLPTEGFPAWHEFQGSSDRPAVAPSKKE